MLGEGGKGLERGRGRNRDRRLALVLLEAGLRPPPCPVNRAQGRPGQGPQGAESVCQNSGVLPHLRDGRGKAPLEASGCENPDPGSILQREVKPKGPRAHPRSPTGEGLWSR